MIDIDEVRPLIVASPPFPVESFQGFFARTLAKTVARGFNVGLHLAKVEPRPRTKRTFFSQDELAQLATLLNVDVALLTTMALPDISRKRHQRMRVRSFFGTRVPFSMVDHNVRRISPPALGNISYHRAMWTLRLFDLDGETLERLVSHCPVCNQELGWHRSVHPAACDKCVDNAGRSNVDLRDFPTGPADIQDPDAYRYVYSLINPKTEGKFESRGDLSGVSRAVCYEAIFAMVRWMLQEPITRNALASLKNGFYQKITPDVVASAGRYFLAGHHGLRDFETRFPGLSHNRSFGVIVSLDRYLGAGAVSFFEDVVRPSRARLIPAGLRSVTWLNKRVAVPEPVIRNLANEAMADRWPGTQKVAREDAVRALEPVYQDILSFKRCSEVLGLTSPQVAKLLALGIFQEVKGVLRLSSSQRQFLSGASVTAVLKKLDDNAQRSDFRADVDFRRATYRTPFPIFCAMAAALDDDIEVGYTSSSLPCWSDAYGPRSLSEFTKVITRLHNSLVAR